MYLSPEVMRKLTVDENRFLRKLCSLILISLKVSNIKFSSILQRRYTNLALQLSVCELRVYKAAS